MSSALELADKFLAVHLQIRRRLDSALAETGLSLARYRFLAMLSEHGPCRSIDMAKHFGFAPRSITEAIDTLEHEGLAIRMPDPHDRRAKVISITEKGLEALRVSSAYRKEVVEAVFANLDHSQRDHLQTILDSLVLRLTKTAAGAQKTNG